MFKYQFLALSSKIRFDACMRLKTDVKFFVRECLGSLFHVRAILDLRLCIGDISHENAFSCELMRNMMISHQLVALNE